MENSSQKKKARKTMAPPSGGVSAEDTDRHAAADLTIVGLGASAGGLDALQKVLPGLPANAGIAYVVVQHMAPKPHSLLPSLLSRSASMPVETIRDGTTVRASIIYITPPKKDVFLSGNCLKLKEASPIGPKPSIDYFFNSLAEEKKDRAVGIILSGSGADGAHGIRAIKSNDGITMAQTVESAKFSSMPRAAIDTGLVDLVLPPEKIGQELETALKYPNMIAGVRPDRYLDEISMVLSLLQQHTGGDFSRYKQDTIYRRIGRRMVINKIHDLGNYISHIEAHPEELVSLNKDLLISVTRFFRDTEAFSALADGLREVLKNKAPGDSLRVWVPGCATGEEAYSIAILLNEILGRDLNRYQVQIFGTDVDNDSVQIARRGTYPIATIMDSDREWFERHFTIDGNDVKVKKHIRNLVVLAHQDLIKDTPFLHLDLISCRNLMIYLNEELQGELLSLFHYSLNPEALLFLGKSETVNQRKDLFNVVDARWRIYQRRSAPAKKLPVLMRHHYMTPAFSTQPSGSGTSKESRAWQESKFVSALLDVLGSCAVLTDEQGNILYIRGDVSPYFKIPEGRVKDSLNAIEMAKPEIRFILQSLLHKVNKLECAVASNCVALGDGGNGRGVQIRVGPVKEAQYPNSRLIVLTPMEMPARVPETGGAPETEEEKKVHELERELAATRDHLQDTIEELETTTEELQSLNEELQSANEELQASNEELETSNEELQASNEELNTVNDELRAKSDEAAELMDDLKKSEARYRDLVQSANSAIVRWRSDGTITFSNDYAQTLFGYEEDAMLGQPVEILVPDRESTGNDLTGLARDIVAQPGKFISNINENICRDGRRVWINWTNRAILDETGEVVEVLAIGNDITLLKEAEDALHESEGQLKASLAEKETLIKEIHHRVKNNMQIISSLISLQTDTIADTGTHDLLQDLSHRVRSMAIVHEKLYQAENLSQLELSDYVRSLLRYLWGSLAPEEKPIHLSMDLDPVLLSVEKAVPCGLIINELVNNAVKHAFNGRDDGRLTVTLKKDGQRGATLSVRDNGIGMPHDLDWGQTSTLGLRLIQMLSKQLHATVDILQDEGTEFRIAFEGSGQ